MSEEKSNPLRAAQAKGRVELRNRFYRSAVVKPVDGGFAVALDGRIAKTPAGRPLAVNDLALGTALAAEWEAQRDKIDPAEMPLNRLVNAAIDRVAEEMDSVRAGIVAYAGNDLICYRADTPQALVAAQEAAWEPLVLWARETLGVRLVLIEGVVHVPQHPETLAAIGRAIEPYDALTLAALHAATTLTGSAIIALALARGRLGLDDAWAAAHVDEDWQMSQWGMDELALERRAARFREMEAAALVLKRDA
jgi:chaperone required for assembly of F1-ATPase